MTVPEGVEMNPSENKFIGGGLRTASGSPAPLRLDHGYFEHEVRPMLGSILVEKGWVTHERLDAALEQARLTGMRLGETLLARGWLFEPELASALAEQAGLVQDLQVPGDRLRGDVEVAGDVTDRAGAAGDELEDGAAVRLGERLEGRVRVHGSRPRKATSRCVTGRRGRRERPGRCAAPGFAG